MARSSCSRNEAGFSLIEVLIAAGLLGTAMIALGQLFAMSTRSNLGARTTTYAAVLAEQKIEELRALTWGFDTQGLPVTDTTSNTAVSPETANGGTGLSPSPSSALQENTPGYVDYVGLTGEKMGTGGAEPPADAVYTRRWSIEPLPTNPNNTIIIQVLVTRIRDRGAANEGAVARLPEEARLITVKTRKAP